LQGKEGGRAAIESGTGNVNDHVAADESHDIAVTADVPTLLPLQGCSRHRP
jgi:hypothetical protein